MFWLYVNNYYREINKINLTCVSKKFRYFGTLPPRNIYDFKNWRKVFCSSRFWISPPPPQTNTLSKIMLHDCFVTCIQIGWILQN